MSILFSDFKTVTEKLFEKSLNQFSFDRSISNEILPGFICDFVFHDNTISNLTKSAEVSSQ